MIPVEAVYLFFLVVGLNVGWIINHCIIGYRYEKLIRDEYMKKSGGF